MSDSLPYNPLEKQNLGASVAAALLGRKARALDSMQSFKGAGVYAIYYKGSFSAYRRLAALNDCDDPQLPIYVGKAVPAGGRKGVALNAPTASLALYKRLSEHAESIRSVSNLNIRDFACRYLVVDDIWIPLGESLLIAKFSPIWNSTLDGFGNHDPGRGRYEGVAPRWDVLHPGREWASRCKPRMETAEQIGREVQTRLDQDPSLDRARFFVEQKGAGFTVTRDFDD
jgi:Eco29kI restriction endonuclease